MTHVSKLTIEIKHVVRILKHGDTTSRFITSRPLTVVSVNLIFSSEQTFN